ncbi:ribbon-helix-helix protein [Edaphosphingomonas haloaromaticamans]|uniref:Uncharacterized protein n=1 Tax=Edaphosphingomonas haloaromaticamans TaxID=653954 RepID=A0A1S1HE42_9SPHN|nr:hypothetical protein [Sphingomonas haloaromaticamans]OHT20072.1 hypothetical protein BHE75_02066 [Sphingomonas haloaromaticamans]TNE43196.1 MAG: hypothetical protein EP345_04635 [Sphingomonadales bacterium]
MSGGGRSRRGFAARPRSADAWIAAPEASEPSPRRNANSARLTIDVTPDLRRRLKLAALQRGITLADLVRAMLAEAFPEDDQGRAP